MRDMIELIKRGMNKRGDVETDYPIEFIIAAVVIFIVVVGGIIFTLLPKGLGAFEYISRLWRGG